MEEQFIKHEPIMRDSHESTAAPIYGKCFICQKKCCTTSWHIKLGSWVYICSEECMQIKNKED